MFVGATLLALGYQIFMNWVATNPEEAPARAPADHSAASGLVLHFQWHDRRATDGWKEYEARDP
jgi:hypothetical protein